MVHHSECPLFSSEMIAAEVNCLDHFVSGKAFAVFRCSACGFMFTQDYPGESEIGHYYESDEYISHSDAARGLINKLYFIARGIMLKRKKNLIINKTRIKKGNLLDIGSGTGYFASAMKNAGWMAQGIEINEKAREFSRSHFGIEVGTPDQVSALKTASFDCITLWHVLEHFHDPFTYITEIYRLLKPGGFCIIALPNCSSYDAKSFGPFWAAWDVPRHLWHFNPYTFRLFSDKSGFSFESLRILPLDVFYISLMSEKYKGSSLPFFKGIVKASGFAFFSVFNRRRSSSVIYILRKPIG
jgi:2-polyprenyl-3-methyl-5-hydroxy-6-metoxy-1,4-benzoquinol methylase